jgi:hypothetical protein
MNQELPSVMRVPALVLAVLAGCIGLGGCAGDVLATFRGSPPPPAAGAKVDAAFAATLTSAPAGASPSYKRPDGADLTLTLGAAYESARGQTCRIGRDDANRMVYGFCRAGADWYAIPPAAITDG